MWGVDNWVFNAGGLDGWSSFQNVGMLIKFLKPGQDLEYAAYSKCINSAQEFRCPSFDLVRYILEYNVVSGYILVLGKHFIAVQYWK